MAEALTRTLALKRDVLRELSSDELGGVVGGTVQTFSCLDYVSCDVPFCLRTVRDCIE